MTRSLSVVGILLVALFAGPGAQPVRFRPVTVTAAVSPRAGVAAATVAREADAPEILDQPTRLVQSQSPRIVYRQGTCRRLDSNRLRCGG